MIMQLIWSLLSLVMLIVALISYTVGNTSDASIVLMFIIICRIELYASQEKNKMTTLLSSAEVLKTFMPIAFGIQVNDEHEITIVIPENTNICLLPKDLVKSITPALSTKYGQSHIIHTQDGTMKLYVGDARDCKYLFPIQEQ